MNALRRIFTAVALSIAITTSLLTFGCGGKSTIANLQAVVAGAQDVVNAMSKADPRFAQAQKFLDDAKALLAAYQAAATGDQCASVATIAANIVSAFQAVILPLLGVNPLLAAAVAGIDVALRLVIANFHNCVAKATAAVTKTAARLAIRIDDGLAAADRIFQSYLASPAVAR